MPVTSSGGTGGRPTPSVMYASFKVETEAGEGPALLSFQNDTKFSMSFWLSQAVFLAVPEGSTVGPQLAVSAAVEVETTTGQHKDNACVRSPIAKVLGPAELEPGLAYTMSVALDEAIGFVGTLTEAPTLPFVAVRAQVFDRTSDGFVPSRVELDTEGLRETRSLRLTTYDEGRTMYQLAGAEALITTIRFTAGNGERFVGTEPITLGGSAGYTVTVADEPVDRAGAVVALKKTTE